MAGKKKSAETLPKIFVLDTSVILYDHNAILNFDEHDVAIPINRIKQENNKLVLPGATKEAPKALPEFQYAEKGKTQKNTKG